MMHLDPEVIEQAAAGTPSGEVATHLSTCEDCRGHVKRAKARQRLLSGMKPYTLSDMAFRRVEARLDEAVAAGEASPSSWRWLWLLGGLTAVAAVAFLVVSTGQTGTDVVKLPSQQQVASARAPFHPLTVLKVAPGAQLRRGDEPWRAVNVGDVAIVGDALSANALTLAAAEDVAWALAVEGSLSLGGAASLTLGAGQVVAKVGSPIEVLASSRRMIATSALFTVSRTGAEVVLAVAEGQVEVVDSLTGERRTVKAPQALRWSDGSSLSESRDEALAAMAGPAVPQKPWVRFDASSLAAGTLVSLDGVQLGAAPFIELVTAGKRRLGLTPPGGTMTESWADLIGGTPFTATYETPMVEREGPEPDAEALGRVMAALKAQRPKLASCYEKWLKANPAAEGEVVLELVVGAQGRVKKARVESGTISPASSECLVTTAKSLVLPPLGTEATLQIPLLLRKN